MTAFSMLYVWSTAVLSLCAESCMHAGNTHREVGCDPSRWLPSGVTRRMRLRQDLGAHAERKHLEGCALCSVLHA